MKDLLGLLGILIPITALSIPLTAIILSYRHKGRQSKIRELELQKEILEKEIEKQDSRVKLLEAENRNLDRLINQ